MNTHKALATLHGRSSSANGAYLMEIGLTFLASGGSLLLERKDEVLLALTQLTEVSFTSTHYTHFRDVMYILLHDESGET